MGERIKQTRLGRLGEVLEILLLEGEGIAVPEGVHVFRDVPMNRSEDVVERRALVQFAQPRFHSGKEIALETEQYLETFGRGVGRLGDEGDVFVELLRRHPHPRRESVRHRAVAGHDDAREPLCDPVLHVEDGMPLRVFAERGVHVAVEKDRVGHEEEAR